MQAQAQSHCDATSSATEPAAEFSSAFVAQMSAQITTAVAALNRIGKGEIAADAFTAGLAPDETESRLIMANVIAELGQKQTEAIAKIIYGALRVLRSRGVRLQRIIEDEIEEAILEQTSRTTGLGDVLDTLHAGAAS